MKTLLNSVFAGIAVFALSACGGGGGGSDSPVQSFNFADLDNRGYGVEFDDGDAYVAFGCGEYVRYEEGGYVDSGTFELVDNIVEMDSVAMEVNTTLKTSAEAPGEIKVGGTYEVTDETNSTFSVKATWIQEDNQTCL
jgi:hypothetical protein